MLAFRVHSIASLCRSPRKDYATPDRLLSMLGTPNCALLSLCAVCYVAMFCYCALCGFATLTTTQAQAKQATGTGTRPLKQGVLCDMPYDVMLCIENFASFAIATRRSFLMPCRHR